MFVFPSINALKKITQCSRRQKHFQEKFISWTFLSSFFFNKELKKKNMIFLRATKISERHFEYVIWLSRRELEALQHWSGMMVALAESYHIQMTVTYAIEIGNDANRFPRYFAHQVRTKCFFHRKQFFTPKSINNLQMLNNQKKL